MGRNKSAISRNYFTLGLFRKLFAAEAEMIFGEDGIIQYLCIPTQAGTINEIKNFRHTPASAEVQAYNDASNLVSRVFARPGLYQLSNDMLDKVAKRFTFFGSFNSYDAFEAYYSKWAEQFSEYTGKDISEIPPSVRLDIRDLIDEVYKSEKTYLRQNGMLDSGMPYPNIIRLDELHVIYEVVNRNKFQYSVQLTSPVSATRFYQETDATNRIFILVNPHLKIVGRVALLPVILVDEGIGLALGAQRIYYTLATFKNNTAIVVEELLSHNLKHFYTLLCRLPDIFDKLQEGDYNSDIIMHGNEAKFHTLGDILGFAAVNLETKENVTILSNFGKEVVKSAYSIPIGECFFVNNYNKLKELAPMAGFGIDLY